MDWKDNLNLFATDGFFYRHFSGEIETFNRGFHLLRWLKENNIQEFNRCSLIARKIEDMSDEEQEIFNYNFSEQKVIDSENNTWFTGDYEPFLYLLSIGVYPFDQSHFETESLIDINELRGSSGLSINSDELASKKLTVDELPVAGKIYTNFPKVQKGDVPGNQVTLRE